jgi:phage head maturation protease
MKQEKSKEDRLKEGLSLLMQLQKGGVRGNSLGFLSLKQHVSEWVESGAPWDGIIPFTEYGREAVVSFPRYNNKAAGLNFKVVKTK